MSRLFAFVCDFVSLRVPMRSLGEGDCSANRLVTLSYLHILSVTGSRGHGGKYVVVAIDVMVYWAL